MIALNILLLVVGFVVLVKGADCFVEGSSNLAKALGVSTLIIGLTVVAFGTSAPECAVSAIASFKGNSDISIGNVVGSNICNLLLVLGSAGLFGNLVCKKKIIERDVMYSLMSYVVLIIMCLSPMLMGNETGIISRTNGALLLCFLIIYVYSLVIEAKSSRKEKQPEEKRKLTFKDIIFIVLGLVAIVGGGELVVNSAKEIAREIGISDRVIALTIVAIGTSLPELVTAVMAVKKGEHDMAIGNVIGSNIFNIFMILGLSATINPLVFNVSSFIDMLIMFVAGISIFLLLTFRKKIDRKGSILLLSLYIAYMIFLAVR